MAANDGINLDSTFGLVRAAAAQMLRQEPLADSGARGHMVGTCAGREHGGPAGEAFHADYAASKGALVSLTKSLSSELGRRAFV